MLQNWKRLSRGFLPALIAVSALCLWSCSTTKRATTASLQTESNVEQQVIEREIEHERLDVSTVTEQATDEEVVTTEREYDTTRPTDPATGTPPLKRETTQTRHKVDAGRQEQTVAQTADRQQDVTEQVVTQSRDDIEVETNEKRGLNATQKILCSIGSLALLAALVWLALKLKRLYKPF